MDDGASFMKVYFRRKDARSSGLFFLHESGFLGGEEEDKEEEKTWEPMKSDIPMVKSIPLTP